MSADTARRERFLAPGELWFDRAPARARTLLGSCVAVTLWHPGLRVGGMCHFLLPTRGDGAAAPPDPRYGDEAIEILLRHAHRRGTAPSDYVARIFGGSATLESACGPIASGIGALNARQAERLLAAHGIATASRRTGGDGHRTIRLDLETGEVLEVFTPRRAGTASCARSAP